MAHRRSLSGGPARRRTVWHAFWVIAVLGLGAGVVPAMISGGRSDAVSALMAGLCLVGIAAAFLASLISPLPDLGTGRQSSYGAGGFIGGGGDFGGGGFGDGGGGCS